MQHQSKLTAVLILSGILVFSNCNEKKEETAKETTVVTAKNEFGEFESKEKWGEYLVTITGCNHCHTPKKMSPMGPVLDSALLLSGHPEKMPAPNVNRNEMESKGLVVTQTLTAWVGPWGISYAANLTPDSTGIGNWSETQFMYALRHGKYKGLPDNRPILPPMPWEDIGTMKDAELSAVFAYLKSVRPVNNRVPMAAIPVSPPPAK